MLMVLDAINQDPISYDSVVMTDLVEFKRDFKVLLATINEAALGEVRNKVECTSFLLDPRRNEIS